MHHPLTNSHVFVSFHVMFAFLSSVGVQKHSSDSSALQAPFAFGEDWKSTTSSEALVLDPQPPIGTEM